MANPTMRDLIATVAALQAEVTSLKRTQRHRRRHLLPALLVAALVALVPLTILADFAFLDLDPTSPHNDNVSAIKAAGITKGCNPPDYTFYCPKDTVTREEMASFLARTAGLGGNPPVANAKTALTATEATHATAADTATSAGNATTVGGLAPNALLRVARAVGTNTDPFSVGADLFIITALHPTFQDLPGATVTIQVPGDGFVLVSGTVGVGRGSGPSAIVIFARLRDASPGAPASAVSPKATAGSNSADQEYYFLSPTFAFPVSGAGPKTFTLQVAKQGTDAYAFNGVITALYVPFGATGGTTLDVP